MAKEGLSWKKILIILRFFFRTALYLYTDYLLSVRHARNLIWTQSPSLRIGVSRIVGIEGDPEEWVQSGEVKVRHISAPHNGWRFRGLAFQYEKQTLLWTEGNNKKIQSLLLDGTTETQTMFPGTSAEVDGLAVDWVSNNLYWADALYNWITMLPLGSPKSYRIIVNTRLDNPHGLALYPQKGFVFNIYALFPRHSRFLVFTHPIKLFFENEILTIPDNFNSTGVGWGTRNC